MRTWPDGIENAECAVCGEIADVALRLQGGRVLCLNCRNHGRHSDGACAVCDVAGVPIEVHHIASRRQAPALTIPVCLNCHAVLSERQRGWHPSWLTSHHPARFIVQGWLDMIPRQANGLMSADDYDHRNPLVDVVLLTVLWWGIMEDGRYLAVDAAECEMLR